MKTANDYYREYKSQKFYDEHKEEAIQKAATEEDDIIKCICHNCEAVYKERPYLCLCNSNVFLENIK